jgi:hypothetical protein
VIADSLLNRVGHVPRQRARFDRGVRRWSKAARHDCLLDRRRISESHEPIGQLFPQRSLESGPIDGWRTEDE